MSGQDELDLQLEASADAARIAEESGATCRFQCGLAVLEWAREFTDANTN